MRFVAKSFFLFLSFYLICFFFFLVVDCFRIHICSRTREENMRSCRSNSNCEHNALHVFLYIYTYVCLSASYISSPVATRSESTRNCCCFDNTRFTLNHHNFHSACSTQDRRPNWTRVHVRAQHSLPNNRGKLNRNENPRRNRGRTLAAAAANSQR